MVDKQCKLEYCDKPVRYGKLMLCKGHYNQYIRRNRLCKTELFTPLHVKTKNVGKCSIDGCPRDSRARGMCNVHYTQKRRGLPYKPAKPLAVKPMVIPKQTNNLFGIWYQQVFGG